MPRQRREIPWLEIRDEIYYVWWNPEGGGRAKHLSLGVKNKVEAQKRYAKFLAGGQAEFEAHAGGPIGVTVAQALADYLREHVATKVVDRARAEVSIRHLTAWFGTTPVAKVDIPASRGYADARRKGVGGNKIHTIKVGDSTIRRELAVLQAAANHAVAWKRITASELPSLELPAVPPQEETYLTLAELALARNTATQRLCDFIDMVYYTGARRASIERLTKIQVDLKHSRINLTSPNETAAEKRSKKRRPVVGIHPKLRPVVERLMLTTKTEFIFGEPLDMYWYFRHHMEAVGLHAKAFPHVLRHSRATHLLQAGVPIYDVAKLLGDTIATVERVYGHHCPDHNAAVMADIGVR